MLPMSSSRSHNTPQRPNGLNKLARSQSILGSFKSLVIGIWSGNEEDQPGDSSPAKRRQDDGQVSLGDPARSKRVKVDPPPQQPSNSPLVVGSNDDSNDPGEFQLTFTPSNSTSSHSSISIPSNASITRTMSMDPPSFRAHSQIPDHAAKPPFRPTPTRRVSIRPSSSPTPYARQSSHDISMRDASLPPYRPSPLRMRTSMSTTPQPSGHRYGPSPLRLEREGSEPPPITNLMDNPTFVKNPVEPPQTSEQHSTLGELVDGRARSPSLQRSLYPPIPPITSALAPVVVLQAPQRALRDLDAYRTPIVPSRLRESSIDPVVAPDPSRLDSTAGESTPVIMEDAIEMDSSYSRLGSGTTSITTDVKPRGKPSHTGQEQTSKNQGKPYAGEGGLRRLLIRRREEFYEEGEQQRVKNEARETREASVSTDTDSEMTSSSQNLMPLPLPPPSIVPLVPTRPLSPPVNPPDQPSSSSLRVGRTRTARIHMRPMTRPNKVKFSAAYEDEEGSAGAVDENVRREREMKELYEAAKRVPAFNIPANFSFVEDGPLVPHDSSSTKEPPTPLPFDKPSSAPSKVEAPPLPHQLENNVTKASEQLESSSTLAATTASTSAFVPSVPTTSVFSTPTSVLSPPPPPPPLPKTAPDAVPLTESSATVPPSTGGSTMPNFFSNSSFLSSKSITGPSESTLVPDLPSLNFTQATPAVPVKDKDNPLWEGDRVDKGKRKEPDSELFSVRKGKKSAAHEPSDTGALSSTSSGSSLLGQSLISTAASAAPLNGNTASLFGHTDSKPVSGSLFSSDGKATATLSQTSRVPSTGPYIGDTAIKDSRMDPSAYSIPFTGNNASMDSGSVSAARPIPFGTAPDMPATNTELSSSITAIPPSKESNPATPFTNVATTAFSGFGGVTAVSSTTTKPSFTFGLASSGDDAAAVTTPTRSPFSQTLTVSSPASSEAPKPLFGAGGGFTFGQSSSNTPTIKEHQLPPAPPPFVFGATASTTSSASSNAVAVMGASTQSEKKQPPTFHFGLPTNPSATATVPEKKAATFSFGVSPSTNTNSSPFSFDAPTAATTIATAGSNASMKPFTFGSNTTMPARPVTPPNADVEVKMEESPSRGDINMNGSRGGFTMNGFGGNGALFSNMGSTLPAQNGLGSGTTSFSFGGSVTTSSSSIFGAKAEGSTAFGQSTTAVPAFSFNQPVKDSVQDASRPSSAPGFSFGVSTPTSTNPPAFAFSASSTTPTPKTNPFGQQPSSAPSSPSTFGANSTSFGLPVNTAPNTFTFGSQPASPASTGGNLPLTPVGGAGPGFNFSGGTQNPPSFTPPTPVGGGPLFTIGAAPPPPTGQRQIKKLPTRRGGKR